MALALASAAVADPASDAAAVLVRAFVVHNARGCGHVQILSASARPTIDSEVSETRPAGFDVTLTVSGAADFAQFLVAGGQVYADNPIAGALATGCVRDPGTPVTQLDWHALPYLDVDAGRILSGSSGPWRGAVVNHSLPHFAQSLTEGAGKPVWASRCSPTSQTVRFDRTMYLLGRPDALQVNVHGVTGTGPRRLNGVPIPFTLWKVAINGRRVFKTTTPLGGSGAVGPRGLGEVRPGLNTIEVIVVKRGDGACNGTTHRQYGVTFSISGSFHADAAVTDLPVHGKGACLNGQCTNFTENLPFEISNKGPATLLEPGLRLHLVFVNPDQVVGDAFTITQSGLTGARCDIRKFDVYDYEIVCGWQPFAPHARGRLNFRFVYKTPAPPFTDRFTVSWASTGLAGGATAGGSKPVTVCGGLPGCP